MRQPITFNQRGTFARTREFLTHSQELDFSKILHAYGQKGVALLTEATPVDTGETQKSWSYGIAMNADGVPYLDFYNSNKIGHTSIVKLIVYGHGTKQGVYIEPTDFISPVIEPIFKALADDLWKEVKRR